MPAFEYTALDASSRHVSGKLEANGRPAALRILEDRGLQPIKLTIKEDGASGKAKSSPFTKKLSGTVLLSSRELIYFTEDLCDLLDAGLQLEPAMQIMEKRQSSERIKYIAGIIRQNLREGTRFAQALATASPSFNHLYCSLAEAGEASGSLSQMLRQQIGFMNAMSELRSKATQALIYPAFILGTGIVIIILFMTNLVPQLKTLFEQTGSSPPWVTQLLIGSSNFVVGYWWLILSVLAAAIIGFWSFIQTNAGRAWWDRARPSLPGIGGILKTRFLAQFSRTMATLLSSGIPLINSLKLARNGVDNVHYREALDQSIIQVGDGASLARSLSRTGTFPKLFTDLLEVGERTGQLARSLDKSGERYEREMDDRIKKLIALIGPIVLIILTFIVAVVAYSIVTSIFEAISGLKTRF
ncbi:MAG: type II secretion system F family protein [Verrucomicrobiota bacterium]